MLFDLSPKEKKADLFDRRREMAELSKAVGRNERLIVVYGVRRIGKTSLLRSFLSDKEFFSLFLDIRKIYNVHRRTVPANAFYENVVEGVTALMDQLGISVEEQITALSFSKLDDLTSLLSNIDRWCSSKKMRFLLVLDEAQYLRFSKRVSYDGLIAWSIDNLKSITFILSGSEVGLLKEMLDYSSVKAPLYGRLKSEIVLDRLKTDESREFLVRGFKEQSMDVKETEMAEILDDIDGMIGWLTYYGYFRTVKGLGHKDALAEVFAEGSKVALAEVDTLIKGSKKRYTAIISAVANGMDTWSGIHAYAAAKAGKIPDSVLDKLLASLIKFSIIEKTAEGKYRIIDPVIKRYFLGK